MILVDLHTHTNRSDGIPSVQQVEAFCIQNEMGVAITDHNEIRGSLDLLHRDQVPCLPGIEVGTEEGIEFLVYFNNGADLEQFYIEQVEPGLRPRFMVRSYIKSIPMLEAAADMGAYISMAHPYAFGRKSLDYHRQKDGQYKPFVEKAIEIVNAVEKFNGGVPAGVNAKAKDLHLELEKNFTVGSDSHLLATYGSVGVKLELTMEARSIQLFDTVKAFKYAEVIDGNLTSVFKTVPIIMLKHTLFFFSKGNARKYEREVPAL